MQFILFKFISSHGNMIYPLHLISTHVEQEEVRFEKGMEKNKYFIISPNNANAMIMQRLKKQKCYNMISRCDKIYLFR